MNLYGGVNKSDLKVNKPLKLYQPFNLLVFLSLYSPVIIALTMVSSSFVQKNWKGLIFFGFLIASTILRIYIYYIYDPVSQIADNQIFCNSVQYSPFGNSTFSVFVFAFTITYIAIPMFSSNNINVYVFAALLGYTLIDIFVRMFKKCIPSMIDLFLNVFGGAAISAIFVLLMYAGGSKKYLFYTDDSDSDGTENGTKCSTPTNQTFKCRVYKNGELISG
jgi:magnesium-transporting ATPase (P-type)